MSRAAKLYLATAVPMTRGVNTAGGGETSHHCRAGRPGPRVLRVEPGLSLVPRPVPAEEAKRLWRDGPGSSRRAPRASAGAQTCGHVACLRSAVKGVRASPHPPWGRPRQRGCSWGWEQMPAPTASPLCAQCRASICQWAAESPTPSPSLHCDKVPATGPQGPGAQLPSCAQFLSPTKLETPLDQLGPRSPDGQMTMTVTGGETHSCWESSGSGSRRPCGQGQSRPVPLHPSPISPPGSRRGRPALGLLPPSPRGWPPGCWLLPEAKLPESNGGQWLVAGAWSWGEQARGGDSAKPDCVRRCCSVPSPLAEPLPSPSHLPAPR